jgi:hypothetical protein
MTEMLSEVGLIFCTDDTLLRFLKNKLLNSIWALQGGRANFGNTAALNKSNLGLPQRDNYEDSDLWDCYFEQ